MLTIFSEIMALKNEAGTSSSMLLLPVLALSLVQPPPLKQQAPANTRRAALLAGGSAALSLIPAMAGALSVEEIAAKNNKMAEDARENRDDINKDEENKQIAFACFVALIVFLGPVTGIRGAQGAIQSMSEDPNMDPKLKASLQSNDPKIGNPFKRR